MSVDSKWVRPGIGTKWWTIPRRTEWLYRHRCRSVSAVADIFRKPEGLRRVKECLNEETNIDVVLVDKMFQFKLREPHTARIPASEAQGFRPFRPPKARCHIPSRRNNDLPESPRAGCSCGQGGDGRDEPTSQLHTCLEGKAIEDIRDFPAGGLVPAVIWVKAS